MSEIAARLDAFFEHYYRRNPVNATFTGVHAADARLPDWSEAGLESAEGEMRGLRDDLNRGASADEWTRMDQSLAVGHLEIRMAEDAGSHGVRVNPAHWSGEAVFSLVSLMLRRFAPADIRAESLALRLAGIPQFLDAARTTLSRAAPSAWTERALRECIGARLLIETGIPLWLRAESVGTTAAERVAGAVAAASAAFGEFADWLRARPSAGDDAVACGSDLLTLLVNRGHGSDRAPAELLRDAKERFAVARPALELAAREFCGSWDAVDARLAAARPEAAGFLSSFDRTWSQCRQRAERHDVVTWPDWPVRYVHQPAWAQAAAPYLYFLHYRAPAPFDTLPALEYLVPPVATADPDRYFRTWNHAAIKLNHVVHHGAIGHHVQNWHACNRSRSRIGKVAAVDCASRIGMFCGGTMAEGWACYATALMEEIGFLTPLERLSEQHSRVRFLARAIVDLSLHTGEMQLADAARFYHEQAGLTAVVAANEAARNSIFPGTGLMYWLGAQGIVDLREEMQRRQGAGFSLKRFHDDLLEHGSIPVPVAARHMMDAPA